MKSWILFMISDIYVLKMTYNIMNNLGQVRYLFFITRQGFPGADFRIAKHNVNLGAENSSAFFVHHCFLGFVFISVYLAQPSPASNPTSPPPGYLNKIVTIVFDALDSPHHHMYPLIICQYPAPTTRVCLLFISSNFWRYWFLKYPLSLHTSPMW